jgi:Zn finger protein HypA/HybF involved in hydrogenase expression
MAMPPWTVKVKCKCCVTLTLTKADLTEVVEQAASGPDKSKRYNYLFRCPSCRSRRLQFKTPVPARGRIRNTQKVQTP